MPFGLVCASPEPTFTNNDSCGDQQISEIMEAPPVLPDVIKLVIADNAKPLFGFVSSLNNRTLASEPFTIMVPATFTLDVTRTLLLIDTTAGLAINVDMLLGNMG